jgi:hypothetical protein
MDGEGIGLSSQAGTQVLFSWLSSHPNEAFKGEGRILIPKGYITIPEALRRIRNLIDDDDFGVRSGPPIDRERLIRFAAIDALGSELIQNFGLDAYMVDGGRIRPIPKEDMELLIRERWSRWAESGRVKAVEEGELGIWPADIPGPTSDRYDGCTPLIREFEFKGIWKPEEKVEDIAIGRPSVPMMKTGAAGRPSSMHLVMQEFRRRLANSLCRGSRAAESRDLAAWLKAEHPAAPPVSQKTICNNLPVNFQPYNSGKSKTPPK